MADLTAQRTLVKSPPELWTELSEVESLARHLGELGEIRITKVEPESTVAWEGDAVRGTVELEQSGWGTKVTFTATVPEPGPAEQPAPEEPVAMEPESVAVGPEPAPVAAEPDAAVESPAEPAPEPETKRRGFIARWLFRQRAPAEPDVAEPESIAAEPEPAVTSEPEPVAAEPLGADLEPVAAEPAPTPKPEATEPAPATADRERVQRVLDGTLDALGQAHHRPFSRG